MNAYACKKSKKTKHEDSKEDEEAVLTVEKASNDNSKREKSSGSCKCKKVKKNDSNKLTSTKPRKKYKNDKIDSKKVVDR